MLTGPNVILALKIAVGAVTVLLLASLVALALGRPQLHGRINTVFLILTLTALVGLEVIVRVVKPDIFDYFTDEMRMSLWIHLGFSIPAALLLPIMLWTGRSYRTTLHFYLGLVFLVLWSGTFITGIFFLPHTQ
jgi:hypothetical protein